MMVKLAQKRYIYYLFHALALVALVVTVCKNLYPLFPEGIFFPVRKVQVEGLETIPAKELLKRMGLKRRDSLLFLKQDSLVDKIEGHSRLKVLSIEKAYPDRLIVRVKERSGTFLLSKEGDTQQEIDLNGHVIAYETEGDMDKTKFFIRWSSDLEALEDTKYQKTIKHILLSRFLEVYRALSEEEKAIVHAYAGIHLGSVSTLTVKEGNTQVVLSGKISLDEMRKAWYLYTHDFLSENVAFIDLRYGSARFVYH